jgi:hypothetical protein
MTSLPSNDSVPAYVWKTDPGIQAVLERAVERDPQRPDLLPLKIVSELNAAGYRIVRDPLPVPAAADPRDDYEPPYMGDEPLGTCVIHGDYWTDDCTRCG